ncbi:MAG: hypothetical protein DHS20C16_29890 [Phycisphaerae bacterium]|nr:MAG: hypothetical protein DHS20C16_29890 [Phycisphaerae bacterium]
MDFSNAYDLTSWGASASKPLVSLWRQIDFVGSSLGEEANDGNRVSTDAEIPLMG